MSITSARLPHYLNMLFTRVIGSVLLLGIPVSGINWTGGLVYAQTNTTPTPTSASRNTWTWPAIPGCLADPEIQTKGTTDYNSPICPLYDRLLASGEINIELRSARRVNAEMDGLLYPAFVPGTEVVAFVTTDKFGGSFIGPTGLVRVSTNPFRHAMVVGGLPSTLSAKEGGCSTQTPFKRNWHCPIRQRGYEADLHNLLKHG